MLSWPINMNAVDGLWLHQIMVICILKSKKIRTASEVKMVTYHHKMSSCSSSSLLYHYLEDMERFETFYSGNTHNNIYVDVIYFLTGGRGKQNDFFLTHIGYIRSPKNPCKKFFECKRKSIP